MGRVCEFCNVDTNNEGHLQDCQRERCGCGKPTRYVSMNTETKEEVYSCNKYQRCPSYDDLSATLELANRRLSLFQQAVNEIDDYFEYRNESKKDQKKVHQILGNLSDSLKNNE